MVCLVCGSTTSPGSYMCGRCFKRVSNTLLLGATAIDPMADQRMLSHGSVMLMIGPSFIGEVRLGKGPDPGLTFERMMASEDRSHVPSFIDRYLADLGIETVLRGDEMVPGRELIPRMVNAAAVMDTSDERWARPCLRMANLISLAVKEAASLPIEPSDSFQLVNELATMAEKFYSRAMKDPKLDRTARGNRALMLHWIGRSEEALVELKDLSRTSTDKAERAETSIKMAVVQSAVGMKAEALASLSEADPDDPRYMAIRSEIGGSA
ncbi:MAG: hypothetical protein HPY73_05945 [Methanomassiliicoccales archaeon]|nr:MAG: hypothetical protein HPY73_05945 [Methanomassiliicoccales archaeon]